MCATKSESIAQHLTLLSSTCCILPEFCASLEHSPMYMRGLAATGRNDSSQPHLETTYVQDPARLLCIDGALSNVQIHERANSLWQSNNRKERAQSWCDCVTLRKSMCCILPDFCALMEYSAIYIRGLAATGGLAGMPAVVSKCSSTRSTPHTSRLVLRTGPPPIRQLTSISRGPRLVYFSSTWKTPCSILAREREGKDRKKARRCLCHQASQQEPLSSEAAWTCL